MKVDEIHVGTRFRKDTGNINSLARSIAELGLLHPVVVTPEGKLIAGERRLAAVRALGWTEVPVTVVDLTEIVRGEFAENAERKDFLPSEIEAIRKALAPTIATPVGRPKTSESFANFTKGKTSDKVAAFAGLSGRTVEKIARVVEAAELHPEKFKPLVDEMDRTRRVNGVYKKLIVAEKAAAITAEPPPLPKGPFRVIVADPPWTYELRAADPSQRGQCPYPTMSLDQICTTPVREIAHEDAVLWLWTTNTHLRDAFRVVDAWGFASRTVLTWAKDRMGTGMWLRGQTEHCLLAARGSPTINLTNQSTLLHGHVREHSRKPDEFYQMVEALCPGSKIDLFAREQRPGWAAYGDEARWALDCA